MLNVILAVVPVFGLTLLGYLAGRLRIVSAEAEKGLSEFVVTIAMPVMLFRTMATTPFPAEGALALWSVYYAAVVSIWVLAALITAFLLKRPQGDASAIAMAAAFSNNVFLGLPIVLSYWGEAARATWALIIAFDAPLLWTMATVHLALADRDRRIPPAQLAADLFGRLARNPIILGVLAGVLWGALGLGFHPIADRTMKLLADAAIPCALVSLGFALVGFDLKGQAGTLATILLLKMVTLPLILLAFLSATMPLGTLPTNVLLLFSVMPVGVNAFLFAAHYGKAKHSVAASIAISTALSALMAPLVLLLLGPAAVAR